MNVYGHDLIADVQPVQTAFGVVGRWVVEDLSLDETTVATGLAASPIVAWLEANTAALTHLKARR